MLIDRVSEILFVISFIIVLFVIPGWMASLLIGKSSKIKGRQDYASDPQPHGAAGHRREDTELDRVGGHHPGRQHT